jgi:hypothetical protein
MERFDHFRCGCIDIYNDAKKPLIILIPNNYFFIVGIGMFSLLGHKMGAFLVVLLV